MTAASGFKRLGLALAAVLVLCAGLLGGLSFVITADGARDAVKSEIRAVSGLEPEIRGAVALSFFPFGTATLDNVVIGRDDTGNKALVTERLTARLRFLPLLVGKVEVSDITLVRPTVNVVLQGGGKSNWTPLVGTLNTALHPSADRTASFSEIRVDNGTVVIRNEPRGITETITRVEGSLAWPSMFRSFAATGHFDWRGEPVEGSLTISDLAAALDGDPSGVKLRLTGAPLKLAFEGQFSTRPSMKIEGTVSADSPSLRNALRWAGNKQLPAGGGFARFSLKAKTSVVGGSIALSGVDVELDGNAAEGVLTFASDGRQTLQGTLAAEGVDLTPYVSTVRLLSGSEREWDGGPLTLDSLADIDLDLRLSAAKVKLAGTTLGRTAVATNLRSGKLTVTVGESQSFGGIVKGSFDLAKSERGADVKALVQFTDVNLQGCLGALMGMQRIEGKGNLSFNIEGSGSSVMEVTKTLNGSATLAGAKGALAGVNVEQLLRRLEQKPLSGGGDYRSGRTPYDKLNVVLDIAEGLVTAQDFRMDGQSVRLMLAGKASIPTRGLDFTGTASLIPAGAAESSGFELPFMVRGAWDDPLMLLDTQSLLRHAPAAKPLLDAVRNRTGKDAVRSAIDRLVGNTPPAAAPAAKTDEN